MTEGGYSIVLKGQFGIIKGTDASFGWFCRDGWLSLRNALQLHTTSQIIVEAAAEVPFKKR